MSPPSPTFPNRPSTVPSHVRFMGPHLHLIPSLLRDEDRLPLRRPFSTINDHFFGMDHPDRFERREHERRPERRREVDRSPDRSERRRLNDLMTDLFERRGSTFTDPFKTGNFFATRMDRRREERDLNTEYNSLLSEIRTAKAHKGVENLAIHSEEDTIRGEGTYAIPKEGMVPDEKTKTEEEVTSETIKGEDAEEEETPIDGVISAEKEEGEALKSTSIFTSKRLGPDGQLIYAKCEKTVKENGIVISHEKEEHDFTQ